MHKACQNKQKKNAKMCKNFQRHAQMPKRTQKLAQKKFKPKKSSTDGV